MAWYDFLFGKTVSEQDTDGDDEPDLVKTEVPYEILIRFDEEGSVQGAHVIYRENLYYKGDLLKSEVGMAKPLNPEELPGSELISYTLASALAENSRLQALVEELQSAQETS